TQLAGQLLLVAALVFLVRAMSPVRRRTDLAMCAICVAGLVVVHYRVLIFFGLFAVALSIWHLVADWSRLRTVLVSWARGLFSVMLGLLLAVPWIVNLML